jgi:hypothetical protein
MSGDTRFHVHHDAPVQVGRRERLGVRLLIVADGAFVFGMIFSYFYLRNLNANNGWIPDGGHTLSAMSGWVTVFPLIIAAITHRIAMKSSNGFKNIAPITSTFKNMKQDLKPLNLTDIKNEPKENWHQKLPSKVYSKLKPPKESFIVKTESQVRQINCIFFFYLRVSAYIT